MITSKHLNEELERLEGKIKDKKTVIDDVLKVGCLIAKLLRDVKSNQVKIMADRGIKLYRQKKEDNKG